MKENHKYVDINKGRHKTENSEVLNYCRHLFGMIQFQ